MAVCVFPDERVIQWYNLNDVASWLNDGAERRHVELVDDASDRSLERCSPASPNLRIV